MYISRRLHWPRGTWLGPQRYTFTLCYSMTNIKDSNNLRLALALRQLLDTAQGLEAKLPYYRITIQEARWLELTRTRPIRPHVGWIRHRSSSLLNSKPCLSSSSGRAVSAC
jgi:hypothetical protein